MIRIRSILFMALVGLSVMAIATAEAQQRGGRQGGRDRGMGGRSGGISAEQLLRIEKVRTEVGVSEEEWAQLQTLSERNREGARERYAKLREMSEEDQRAERKKIGEERAKQLAIILSEAKIARLNQLRLQMSGFDALGSPDVVGKLKISPGQGERLVVIRDKMREKSRQGMGDFRSIAQLSGEERTAKLKEMMEKRRKVQDDALKEAVDTVLTTSQQETWKGMIGKPFAIDLSDLMQGRGSRGPGGRGQGGEGAGGRGQGGEGAGGRGQGGRGQSGGGGSSR